MQEIFKSLILSVKLLSEFCGGWFGDGGCLILFFALITKISLFVQDPITLLQATFLVVPPQKFFIA